VCKAEVSDKGDLQIVLDGSILQLKLRPRNEYQTPSGKIEFAASKAGLLVVREWQS